MPSQAQKVHWTWASVKGGMVMNPGVDDWEIPSTKYSISGGPPQLVSQDPGIKSTTKLRQVGFEMMM